MLNNEAEAREAYDEMLNEMAEEWKTPCSTAAENMKEQDPILYRCGFNDWIDGEIQSGNAPEEAQDWSAEE